MAAKGIYSMLRLLLLVLLIGLPLGSRGQHASAHTATIKPMGKSGVFTSCIFKSKRYFICTVDPRKYNVGVCNKTGKGSEVYDFHSLHTKHKGNLIFAINGGMYDEQRHAIGLLVAEGKEQKKINKATGGTGNFTMQPNGVFFIDAQNKATVLTTQQYLKQNPEATYATQSGPMLVTDGVFNAHFTENSANLNIRNGVGVNAKGAVVFAISEGIVNFYEFAQLFRDELDCRNALYLDGAISQYYAPELFAQPHPGIPLGPLLFVTKK